MFEQSSTRISAATYGAVVAIPAHNEADTIRRCLAALAMQRDESGCPVRAGAFEILIYANNCSDSTVEVVRHFACCIPHPIIVIEAQLPPSQLSAGAARKTAMDLAAARLAERGAADGVILTTDADSCVAPTWFSTTMRELSGGVDCVAGYIDAEPLELVGLGPAFLARGRLEDAYLRLIAEIDARCDPRRHDPWPNHRVASGASLAVVLKAYLAIGGLPLRAVGEDAALTAALDRGGFKVRHSMAVSVTTSCRLDGRAQGGAADTMRLRHAMPDAPCDDDLEPALQATRRAIYRGRLRRLLDEQRYRARQVQDIPAQQPPRPGATFDEAWQQLCRDNPVLRRGGSLRPSDLPRQIAVATMVLRHLRLPLSATTVVPADMSRRERWLEPAA
ncbi:Glycosyl transferase, family 2 [Rhodopseudomonas palustris HaA2]|uniref:Glycosyl transferase, family 2 n=1 Tax=Rhodopseudomonas palustris (strain HaA2) TaxID=316058 RepID=Q2ISL6_RHOP2|nr:Glycosyl transferase, family 2 [Rhodopseudomonas palustris HaA2]